jgi:signal transduction histidine kinase
MGLFPALRSYIDGFAERSKIQTTLETPAEPPRLPAEVEIAVFRVAQECLTNIHKHSKSETAIVRLCQCQEKMIVEVADHGKGMPPEIVRNSESGRHWGVGLRGMRERVKTMGGEMSIASDKSGTCVRVTIPCSPAPAR